LATALIEQGDWRCEGDDDALEVGMGFGRHGSRTEPCPSLGTLPAAAYRGQQLEKTAAVKMHEARQIALKAHPGKITDEELEKERGGSGLHYSFDIKNGKKTYEVGVDARPEQCSKTKPRVRTPTDTSPQRILFPSASPLFLKWARGVLVTSGTPHGGTIQQRLA
jgi:hypothetical protein